MATLGGINVFGKCLSCVHTPNATAAQNNEFFGVDGTHVLYGGTRGRVFAIKGAFIGVSALTCIAAESALLSLMDGTARTLVDNFGRTYRNVLFEGRYQADPRGPLPSILNGSPCWSYQYELELKGVT